MLLKYKDFKQMSANEMKSVKGGLRESGGSAECTSECIYSQALCGSTNDYKACSTGSGTYDWKCCKKD